jgi:recombination DNA repair RAD52 pathway protein
MFTNEQNAELEKPLARSAVKGRKQGNSTLSYVEAWHVIAEANRIFGFDGWDRKTVETKCVVERQRKIGQGQYERDGWGVTYTAKVMVIVDNVSREGTGAGHGIDSDLGLAHESAIKEAESDAMKRALMTFGNPFGLALYDKTQENVVDDADDRRPVQQQKQAAPVSNPAIDNLWQEINAISSSRGLELFWKDNVKTILGFDDGNRKRFVDKKDELKTKLSPDLVKEIQEEFPGSRVVDEQLRNHPMAAG